MAIYERENIKSDCWEWALTQYIRSKGGGAGGSHYVIVFFMGCLGIYLYISVTMLILIGAKMSLIIWIAMFSGVEKKLKKC